MDFGWETAKHCIVSYFWCASWLSWPSSSDSGKGFTSIRQLKVWLFRLGGSPDQAPPFTEQKARATQQGKQTSIRLASAKLSKWCRKHAVILLLYSVYTFLSNFKIYRGGILGKLHGNLKCLSYWLLFIQTLSFQVQALISNQPPLTHPAGPFMLPSTRSAPITVHTRSHMDISAPATSSKRSGLLHVSYPHVLLLQGLRSASYVTSNSRHPTLLLLTDPSSLKLHQNFKSIICNWAVFFFPSCIVLH